MKRKTIQPLLAVVWTIATAGAVWGGSLEDRSGGEAAGLALVLQSARPVYVPGELVSLEIAVLNQTAQAVSLPAATGVGTGAVRVFIAAGGGDFQEYRGPGWGLKDLVGASRVEIPPGGRFATAATVLFNHRPETGHLSEMYAREIRGRRLGTDYAFARPGTYRLKAVLHGEDGGTLESGVLELDVREPQGVDRSIWDVLREDPELGFFIQTGSPKGPPETPRSRHLEATLEGLAGSFPQGRQAAGIRAGLAGYRALLEELRASQQPDDELPEEPED